MSLLQDGFREIARKFRRFALGRRIKSAARMRADALRALGQRGLAAGLTGAAGAGLMSGLAETEAKNQQLAARRAALDEQRRAAEGTRGTELGRLDAQARDVQTRKQPLDTALAEQQKLAGRVQQESEDLRRRSAQAHVERQSLEAAMSRPQPPAGFDAQQAAARIAALQAEQSGAEAKQKQLAESAAAALQEIEKLKFSLAPLMAELQRIEGERRQAVDTAKRQIAELRRQDDQVQTEAAGVSRQRDSQLEELGAALAAQSPKPALAAERAAVEAAAGAQSALEAQYEGSLAESRAMPRGTMAKFAALVAGTVLAAGGGAYAVNEATKSMKKPPPQRQARQVVENCDNMPYEDDRSPVAANPGGPYTVTRGGQAMLDGSKSIGKCLKYTWTFSAAPKDAVDPPGHSNAGSDTDNAVFADVDKYACPQGTSGNPGASKRDRRAPTTFLCSMNVTLTVTDGRSTDSKSVVVKVKPRGPQGWQTSVDQNQTETYSAERRLTMGTGGGTWLGSNSCALGPDSGHALHAGSSWEGDGYRLDSVADKNGPFDGWWYVAASSLKIKRLITINADLAEGSITHKVNVAGGHRDIDVLRRSTFEHERLHGKLIFERMQEVQQQGNDPAKIIETLSAQKDDRGGLVKAADEAVGRIESKLYHQPGSDEYVKDHLEIKSRLERNPEFKRGGVVMVLSNGDVYVPWKIPSFATVGDNDN